MERLLALAFFGMFLMAAMAMGTGEVLDASGTGAKHTVSRDLSQHVSANAAEGSALVLNRDSEGQFTLNAQVNGQTTNFLIDTGADAVALTVDEAERLGLPVDQESFGPMGQSASGTAYGTIVEVDDLSIAGQEFHNIEVVVIDGLETNLLGQPVLRRLGKVSLHGDRMTIGGS